MTQIKFLAILGIAVLVAGCGSKIKHQVIASGTSTVDDMSMTTYTVDNDYSILIPSVMKNKPSNPDRFSIEFQYSESDCESFTYEGGSIAIDADTKETYEQRRKEQGNLEQYPFTLQGFSDIGLSTFKEDKTFRMINEEEVTINDSLAIISTFEVNMNVIILGDVKVRMTSVSLQASNGKLYRILFVLFPADELPEETPDWITVVYSSLKPV